MGNKSAKDLAFDKERVKYRQKIKEIERQLAQKEIDIHKANELVDQLNGELRDLRDWVDRLLEYTELSKEDMKRLIKSEKESSEVNVHLNAFFNLAKQVCNSRY